MPVYSRRRYPGDEDYVWREAALFLAAATQSNSHMLPHVVLHLTEWCRAHPEDAPKRTDSTFLRMPASESLHLHQPAFR